MSSIVKSEFTVIKIEEDSSEANPDTSSVYIDRPECSCGKEQCECCSNVMKTENFSNLDSLSPAKRRKTDYPVQGNSAGETEPLPPCAWCYGKAFCRVFDLPMCNTCRIDDPPLFQLKCKVCGERKIQTEYNSALCKFCRYLFITNYSPVKRDELVCHHEGKCHIWPSSTGPQGLKSQKCRKCYLEKCFAIGLTKEQVTRPSGKDVTSKQDHAGWLSHRTTKPAQRQTKESDDESLQTKAIVYSEEYPYQCDKCDGKFKLHHFYLKHRNMHKTNNKKFVCEVCYGSFETVKELLAHKKSAHPESNKTLVQEHWYNCQFCKETFKLYDALIRHKKDVHDELLHKTEFSRMGSIIRTSENTTKRKKVPIKKPQINKYACHFCKETYPTARFRNQHEKDVHWNPDSTVKCEFCHEEFSMGMMDKLFEHKKLVHNIVEEARAPAYTCQDCGLAYGTKGKYQTHIETKHGVYDIDMTRCKACKISFRLTEDLMDHLKKFHPTAGISSPSIFKVL